MKEITEKNNCCGCASCVQICPKQCINFNEDDQGFRYPLINQELCINCGLCKKVCPCLNIKESKQPIKVYAATNPDEGIRMESSSGGMFTILAEYVINKGGVVFGARFNENWEVIHSYTETKSGLKDFRGSKYVQSQIGETFKQAKLFLETKRLVLFSATPCQISGLKSFLRKEYDNLITVEVVCHGVPSPKVWRDYLDYLQTDQTSKEGPFPESGKNRPIITHISFRDKSLSWRKYKLTICGADNQKIIHENARNNLYMKAFLNNLILRPICFNCPFKSGKSHSDFSMADFWSIKQYAPQLDDDKGMTLLYVHTQKALQILRTIEFHCKELDSNKPLNTAFSNSTKEKYPRDKFWNQYLQNGLLIIPHICKKIAPSVITLFINRISSFIKRKFS